MRESLRSWAICALLASLFVGCGTSNGGGDDGESADADAGPSIDASSEPFELSKSSVGVTVHHGAAGRLGTGGENAQTVIERTKSTIGTAFLDVQVYDEHAWLQFGEWEVQSHPNPGGPEYRGSEEFVNNPELGRFENRTSDLVQEVESAFGAFEGEGFSRKGIVLDFWRMRGDWYVRWDGNLQSEANLEGEGNWGFFRDDFVGSVSRQIENVVKKHGPQYMVIGSDMGRLLAREGKPGVAPDEFLNFKQFYRRMVSRIGQLSSKTKVGAGFNWDRFAKHIAPQYGEGEPGSVPPTETLAKAFEAVILPFAQTGGLIALKSYREPEGDASYYRFLATLEQRYDLEDASLIWYSIGSPVESSTSYRRQQTYLKSFIEWNKGVSPELVVWRSLINIDGADQSGQQIGGRCKQMIDNENFQLEKRHCFDGLISDVIQEKDAFQYIQDQVGNTD